MDIIMDDEKWIDDNIHVKRHIKYFQKQKYKANIYSFINYDIHEILAYIDKYLYNYFDKYFDVTYHGDEEFSISFHPFY